jgi:hypothetical protein
MVVGIEPDVLGRQIGGPETNGRVALSKGKKNVGVSVIFDAG